MLPAAGASFSSMASEQSELYDGREQDIMGCFRALAQELEVAEEPMHLGPDLCWLKGFVRGEAHPGW